jgi:hypothetical protein
MQEAEIRGTWLQKSLWDPISKEKSLTSQPEQEA